MEDQSEVDALRGKVEKLESQMARMREFLNQQIYAVKVINYTSMNLAKMAAAAAANDETALAAAYDRYWEEHQNAIQTLANASRLLFDE
ncbi:hypothetical protein [Haematobacter sp.]|uniref:hypothetical protein n=1 Tax=Haematobacter sp. TaxID=2953762 RepID=UPI0028AD64FC|nr:hypothetical protein [Haematobacter sp.]